ADAFVKRTQEIRIAPVSDAHLAVGRDIARVDPAEGEVEGKTAREGLAARRRMATDAIGCRREIFAARDEISLSEFVRNSCWLRSRVMIEIDMLARRERHRAGAADDPKEDQEGKEDHPCKSERKPPSKDRHARFLPARISRSIG